MGETGQVNGTPPPRGRRGWVLGAVTLAALAVAAFALLGQDPPPSGPPPPQPGQPLGKPLGEPLGQPLGEPLGEPLGQPLGKPLGEPLGKPLGEPLGKPLGQPLGKPLGQPLGEPLVTPRSIWDAPEAPPATPQPSPGAEPEGGLFVAQPSPPQEPPQAAPALGSDGEPPPPPPEPLAAPPQVVQETALAFEGEWSATGSREVLPTGSGHRAVTFYFSGSLILTSQQGLNRGFRSVVIGFDNGKGLSVGECVWTDDRGDQIFSEIWGESVSSGKRIKGTITGGTGRYAGITGEYAFGWRYVIQDAEGALQGRAVGLKGTVRLPQAPPEKPAP